MSPLVTSQVTIFFAFILIGMLIGYIFDLFRVLRKSFNTKDFLTYIEDIFFWIITCIILAFSIYLLNKGNLRLYIFIGVIIGAVFYLFTISRYLIRLNVSIIKLFKKIIRMIITVISFPFISFFRLAKKYIILPFNTKSKKNIKSK